MSFQLAAIYNLSMEPDVKTTMVALIKEIRERIPFNVPFSGYCEGRCDVCPEKLIEYLDIEVTHWETKMKYGSLPNASEVDSLIKDYKKIHCILEKQGVVAK